MKVFKRSSFDHAGIELLFYQERMGPNGGRQIYIAKPVDLIFELHEEFKTIDQPTLRIGYQEWMHFVPSMNEVLKESKIPLNGEDSARSELKATKYHLEDLRSLLFKPVLKE